MKTKVYFVMMALLVLAACGSGEVKTEKISIEGNQKKMQALAKEFPSFKNIIMLELKKAQDKINQANKISNNKEKASLLSEANIILEAPFIEKLPAIKKELAEVQDKQKKVQRLTLNAKQKQQAEKIMEEANNIIVEVNGILSKGVASAEEANDLLVEKSSSLRSASTALSRLLNGTAK